VVLLQLTGTSFSGWSGPALSVQRTGPGGLPVLLIDGADPSPPLWLVLHTGYQDLAILDDMVTRAADTGARTVCLCLTADVYFPAQRTAGPWFNASNPLDSRTRGVLDRIVRLHPAVVFIIRLYVQQPDVGSNQVFLNLAGGG
jgi:hypothetical protein